MLQELLIPPGVQHTWLCVTAVSTDCSRSADRVDLGKYRSRLLEEKSSLFGQAPQNLGTASPSSAALLVTTFPPVQVLSFLGKMGDQRGENLKEWTG